MIKAKSRWFSFISYALEINSLRKKKSRLRDFLLALTHASCIVIPFGIHFHSFNCSRYTFLHLV